MVGIVIASHGPLASCMMKSAELICGSNSQIAAVSLTLEMSLEEFHKKLISAVKQVDCGEGVLVLADIPGGSPSNISLQESAKAEDVEVVSGFNLGMLLEILINREGKNPMELAQFACEAGKKSIEFLSKKLKDMTAG